MGGRSRPLAARRPHQPLGLGVAFDLEIATDDAHSLGGEADCRCAALSFARAGDQCHFVLQTPAQVVGPFEYGGGSLYFLREASRLPSTPSWASMIVPA